MNSKGCCNLFVKHCMEEVCKHAASNARNHASPGVDGVDFHILLPNSSFSQQFINGTAARFIQVGEIHACLPLGWFWPWMSRFRTKIMLVLVELWIIYATKTSYIAFNIHSHLLDSFTHAGAAPARAAAACHLAHNHAAVACSDIDCWTWLRTNWPRSFYWQGLSTMGKPCPGLPNWKRHEAAR